MDIKDDISAGSKVLGPVVDGSKTTLKHDGYLGVDLFDARDDALEVLKNPSSTLIT
jgi:hypothetical protein